MGQAEAQNQPFRLSPRALPSLGWPSFSSLPTCPCLPPQTMSPTLMVAPCMEPGQAEWVQRTLGITTELLSPLSSGHKGWGAGRMEGLGWRSWVGQSTDEETGTQLTRSGT